LDGKYPEHPHQYDQYFDIANHTKRIVQRMFLDQLAFKPKENVSDYIRTKNYQNLVDPS